MTRVATVLIFLLSCGWFPHSGIFFPSHGAARHQQRSWWVAQTEQKKDGDVKPHTEQNRESQSATPVPAAGKSGKSAPKAPLTPFKPSEKIKPGQAVDFPVDI